AAPPAAGGDEAPPAGGEHAPPAGGDGAPRAGGDHAPPADGDEAAPAGSAAGRRWLVYALAGAAAAILAGPWVVLALLGCGALELSRRAMAAAGGRPLAVAGPLAALAGRPRLTGVALGAWAAGGLGALAWVAFKVGALSYGGGFGIGPL